MAPVGFFTKLAAPPPGPTPPIGNAPTPVPSYSGSGMSWLNGPQTHPPMDSPESWGRVPYRSGLTHSPDQIKSLSIGGAQPPKFEGPAPIQQTTPPGTSPTPFNGTWLGRRIDGVNNVAKSFGELTGAMGLGPRTVEDAAANPTGVRGLPAKAMGTFNTLRQETNPLPDSWNYGRLERNMRYLAPDYRHPAEQRAPGAAEALKFENQRSPVSDALGISEEPVHPLDVLPLGRAAGVPGMAARIGSKLPGALNFAGRAARAEPVLGIGSLSSTGEGLYNMGRGMLPGGGGLGQVTQGAAQTFMKAPAKMIIPATTASVASSLETPGSSASATKEMQFGGTNEPSIGPRGLMNPLHSFAKWTGLSQDPRVATPPEQIQANIRNFGTTLGVAADNMPFLGRVMGNSAESFVRNNFPSSSFQPKQQLADLSDKYRGLNASPPLGALGQEAHNDVIRQQAAGIHFPTDTGREIARRQLMADALRERGMSPEQAALVQQTPPGVFPYPTKLDLEGARESAGQLPHPKQQEFQTRFNTDVDALAKAMVHPAEQPAAPPAAAPAEVPPQPQASREIPTPPAPVAESDPTFQQMAPQAGDALKARIAAAGGMSAAIDLAGSSSPPQGLEGYWASLPNSSKLLAIAGLSITAISAFRSMFGGGDDDDEGFLSRVLPYLGIGASAFALGGGQIGLTRDALPSMDKYRQLGGALQDSASTLFN